MKQKGQILIIINVVMSVLLLYSLALVNLTIAARQIEKKEDFEIVAKSIAEAGVHKAIWCINQIEGTYCGGTAGASYSGESDVSFGGGVFDVTVTTINASTRELEASGYYPNKTKTLGHSTIRVQISTDVDKVSFVYGAQIAEGGLFMNNNSQIIGSVYANGNIEGTAGARISGDVYIAGGTALTADQEHTAFNSDFIFGKSSPEIDLAQSFSPSISDVLNKVSFYIKKVSNPANINVMIMADDNGEPGSGILASSIIDSSVVGTGYGWITASFISPPKLTAGNTYWIVMDAGQHNLKYWTIGVDAFDSYSNGTMIYSDTWNGDSWLESGYDLNFKIWLGGVETYAKDIIIGANAYAHKIDTAIVEGNAVVHTIDNSNIAGDVLAASINASTIGGNASTTDITGSSVGKDLWCNTYSETTVTGNTYCPTYIEPPETLGPVDMPISDALIEDWKQDAENGGIIEGDYLITEDSDLGPVKINGNLIVDGNITLTLGGTVYVTGEIELKNGAIITLAESFGNTGGIIIADQQIDILNNVSFLGIEENSNILLISMFTSITEVAITINNNSTTAILFAPKGIIEVTNNASLKQVNARLLKLNNNVTLYYESGLSNVSFSSGPSGGWSILEGTWQILN